MRGTGGILTNGQREFEAENDKLLRLSTPPKRDNVFHQQTNNNQGDSASVSQLLVSWESPGEIDSK